MVHDRDISVSLSCTREEHDQAQKAVLMTQSQEHSHTNLPRQLNKFIGREREIIEVKGLLNTTQLLTLTGVGGCGKTRLALQIGAAISQAEAFAQGVWWVELADLTDPD
jgi:MoxR-like ATPase